MPFRSHTFARDEVFPSYFPNAVQAFLSTVVSQLRLRPVNATTIEAVASAGDGLAAIGIDGNLRYREATVQRSHPGGVAGTYDVFVTATEDDIRATPAPFSDFTNYAFDLGIVASGGSPPIVPGTVDVHRKVGELQWSGTAITELRQLVGVDDATMPLQPTSRAAFEAALRLRAAAGQTADILRIEDSTGALLFRVDATGRVQGGGGFSTGDLKFSIQNADHAGWILADHRELTVAAAPALRQLALDLGNPWGSGGGGNPRIIDLRGRVPLGGGSGPGLTARTLGQLVGAETHTLSTAEMPSHTHTSNVQQPTGSVYFELNAQTGGPRDMPLSADGRSDLAAMSITATGGGGAHANMQPSAVGHWFVKL
jgi:microcystin-dependent protein